MNRDASSSSGSRPNAGGGGGWSNGAVESSRRDGPLSLSGRFVVGVHETWNGFEHLAQPRDRTHVPNARRLVRQPQCPRGFTVAQFLEMTHREDLAVQIAHSRQGDAQLLSQLGPQCCLAGGGQV